jgi:predicted HicB family RNase H-like nuclease
VIGMQDVVMFQGKTPAELRKAFTASVDDYLAFCAARGESPTKPFSGKFVARVPPEIHRKISENADKPEGA